MRGHTMGENGRVCPSREKILEVLRGFCHEGNEDFALSIAQELGLPFNPPLPLPASLISTIPVDNRRQRTVSKPDRPLPKEEEEQKPKIENLETVAVGSPPRVPPDISPESLPMVGMWNTERPPGTAVIPAPPVEKEPSQEPTLLVGSDGETVRHGPAYEYWMRRTNGRLGQRIRQPTPLPDVISLYSEETDEILSDEGSTGGNQRLNVLRNFMRRQSLVVTIPVHSRDILRVRQAVARQDIHIEVINSISGNELPLAVIGGDPAVIRQYVNTIQRGSMPDVNAVDSDTRTILLFIIFTALFFIFVLTLRLLGG